MKDNHGHETKVHRKDVKLIDSDVKITELYAELRAMGRRDTQHCMPVKDIPDLGWVKPEEDKEKPNPKRERQEARTEPPKQPQREGPVLRSSKKKLRTAEINVETVKTTVESKEQITSKFLSVAATTTATMLYAAACKLIESTLF